MKGKKEVGDKMNRQCLKVDEDELRQHNLGAEHRSGWKEIVAKLSVLPK